MGKITIRLKKSGKRRKFKAAAGNAAGPISPPSIPQQEPHEDGGVQLKKKKRDRSTNIAIATAAIPSFMKASDAELPVPASSAAAPSSTADKSSSAKLKKFKNQKRKERRKKIQEEQTAATAAAAAAPAAAAAAAAAAATISTAEEEKKARKPGNDGDDGRVGDGEEREAKKTGTIPGWRAAAKAAARAADPDLNFQTDEEFAAATAAAAAAAPFDGDDADHAETSAQAYEDVILLLDHVASTTPHLIIPQKRHYSTCIYLDRGPLTERDGRPRNVVHGTSSGSSRVGSKGCLCPLLMLTCVISICMTSRHSLTPYSIDS